MRFKFSATWSKSSLAVVSGTRRDKSPLMMLRVVWLSASILRTARRLTVKPPANANTNMSAEPQVSACTMRRLASVSCLTSCPTSKR